jgi:RND superfamily putative drug exporter
MLYRWGTLMYRWRWLVIALWAVGLLVAMPAAANVNSALTNGFGRTDTESQRAMDILDEKLGRTPASVTVTFHSDELAYQDAKYRLEVDRVLNRLKESNAQIALAETPYSSGNPNMASQDGRTIYAVVFVDATASETQDMVPQLREALDSDLLQVRLTGALPLFYDIGVVSEDDLRRAETVALPLILLVLVLLFGSLVAAGLPVIMGALSILVTSALIYLLAQTAEISLFVLNIVTLLGLGVAVDFSLLLVNRFREEFPRREVGEALGVTLSTAGRAVLFSAITSVLGFSGLLFFDFTFLRSLGIGGATVVLVSLLAALTLLPAVIGVLGRRVNSLALLRLRTRGMGFWHGLATWVMGHPVAVVVPIMAFLLLLGAPFLGVKLGVPGSDILPADVESREGWDLLSQELGPGELSPIIVVHTSSTTVLNPENVAAMYQLAHSFDGDPRVSRVESIVTIDQAFTLERYQAMYGDLQALQDPATLRVVEQMTRGDVAFMRVFPRYDTMDDETKDLVREIRAFPGRGDMATNVTGQTADLMDTISVMYRDFPKVIVYVLVTAYLALFWLFRSVVLPLKAVIMNGMSIFASFGALVFIFQQGNLEGLLGFTALGFTDAILPIVLFCIVFGLSMDYEVFLLSRVMEIYDETGDNTGSVALGLERTGRIITSAALIMVMVCASFALADIVLVKAFGVGLGLAIFIDATLVRAFLVPALMRILGNLNWWAPSFLRGRARIRITSQVRGEGEP